MPISYDKFKARKIPSHVSTCGVRDVLKRICGWDDVVAPGRDIWITPLYGSYERSAGFVITLNGSPPRGHVFALGPDAYQVFYNAERRGGGLRRCRPKDAQVVLDFLRSSGFDFNWPSRLSPAVSRWKLQPRKENKRQERNRTERKMSQRIIGE